MAPKRGMSAEDKRKTLLAIFHETKDVFVLKVMYMSRGHDSNIALSETQVATFASIQDVEKLGAKRGVVLQSIKDVLQTLVDDDLVHMEKIGSSNYFWSFPSETAVKLQVEISKLEARLEEREREGAALTQQLESKRAAEADAADRSVLMAQLAGLEADLAASTAELQQYAASDPERYQAIMEATPVAIDSSNRWLDNLHALHDWLRKRFQGMEPQVSGLFKEHGFTDEMEYIAA